MNKNFLLLTVLLFSLNLGFSEANYGYNNTYGYVNLSAGGMAANMNISLNCSSQTDSFTHYTLTNSQGYYSFSGIFDVYNSSATQAVCIVNSSTKGMLNITNNVFSFSINPGTTDYYKGIEANFTLDNTGNAVFDFSGLNGTLRSLDSEAVKNKTITLQCPNQSNTTTTDESGFYSFSGVSFAHSCSSSGCELLCNVSQGSSFKPFYIDPQGYSGQTVLINRAENITYQGNVKVNGAFNPGNGSYGNLTSFIFNASSYAADIYSCKYSFNESKNFSSMTDFNTSSLKAFTAYISTPSNGQYNYYVLCNSSFSTETIPRMASYEVHLNGANIIINSPSNSSVFSKNSIFNITLDLPAVSCSYKINQDSNSHSMTNTSLMNFAANQTGLIEGNNTVTFYCTDNYAVVSNKSMNFTADITAPAKTDSFSAKTTSSGNAVLIWNSVSDAAYYYIYRGQSNSGAISFGLISNISAPRTNYEDLNGKIYETYYYKVTPVDQYGNEGDPSYSSSVYLISQIEYQKEISSLIGELNTIKNQALKDEADIKEKSEIIAKTVISNNTLEYLKEFAEILPTSDIETINNIRYLMNGYESKTLEQLKSMDYQITYNLNTYLKNYKKTLSAKEVNATVDSLNITSIINESKLEVNGKTYYKYIITNTIINPSDKLIKSINLSFKVPGDAEISGFETINSTINYSIDSLESLASQSFSCEFFSLSGYISNVSGSTLEVVMPKAMTAYQVLAESKDNAAFGIIIWSLTLILSVSLLFQYKHYHVNF